MAHNQDFSLGEGRTGTTPEGTSDSSGWGGGGGGGSGKMRPPQQSFEKLECQGVVLKAIALYIR